MRDICSGYGSSKQDNRLGSGCRAPDGGRVRRGSPNGSDGDYNVSSDDNDDGTGNFPDGERDLAHEC
jgi:hypothetical protein